MGGCAGSKGYRPEKDQMSNMLGGLQAGYGGESQFSPTTSTQYTLDGKPIDENKYKTLQKMGWGKGRLNSTTTTTPSQYSQNIAATQNYTPGSSGYTAAQTGGTYTPFKYSDTNFQEQVSPYYSGLESSATEGMKAALGQSMEGLKGSMGSRGMLGSGAQTEGTGQLALKAGQGLIDSLRNIKMDKAKSLTDIARENQQMNFQKEQAQAGENQFGANFGENQAARKLQETLAQFNMDTGIRGEKYNVARQPYEDLLKTYLGSLGSASQDKKGWMPGLGNMYF